MKMLKLAEQSVRIIFCRKWKLTGIKYDRNVNEIV